VGGGGGGGVAARNRTTIGTGLLGVGPRSGREGGVWGGGGGVGHGWNSDTVWTGQDVTGGMPL